MFLCSNSYLRAYICSWYIHFQKCTFHCYHSHTLKVRMYQKTSLSQIVDGLLLLAIDRCKPTTIFFGHPALSLTPGAFCLIHCLSSRLILVYTTGSRQQSVDVRTHLLNTPAAVNLTRNQNYLLLCYFH